MYSCCYMLRRVHWFASPPLQAKLGVAPCLLQLLPQLRLRLHLVL